MHRALPPHFAVRLMAVICAVFAVAAPAPSVAEEDSLDPKSPEFAAITLAAPDIKRKEFDLRDDFWSGSLTGEAGKAIRLQFFKGNDYTVYFAAGSDEIAKGTKVFLRVVSKDNEVIAESKGQKGSATSVKVAPPGTGLYLVLMRVEVEGDEERQIPCALFYGYE